MSDQPTKEPQVILCDICTEEEKKPARKTCMKCEISMCVQHLQTHLVTPVLLQTHPLTEPMALCGTTKCSLHGKLLEYYCLDDLTFVCVSCAIEDQHRLHNMKTFSTGYKELMEKLKAEQQALLETTDDENMSLEKWEKSGREKLEQCSVGLIEAVKNLRDIALKSVQRSVSARMVSIKTSKSSLQAAQAEKDTFRFLQMYSQVHQDLVKAKAVDLRKGLEPGPDRDKLVQEIRLNGEKMVEQAFDLWGSLLSLVDPENHQEHIATSSDLTFNRQGFGPALSLSKDSRKVYYNRWLGQCNAILTLSSSLPVPNFQRWTVSFSQETNWTIGLCDKQNIKNVKNGHVYGLCCEGDQLSAIMTDSDDSSDVSVKANNCNSVTQQGRDGEEAAPPPEMVEVFWNIEDSSLSFFRRTGQYQREEIVTMKTTHDHEELLPFVQLGKVGFCFSGLNVTQQKLCVCGKSYNKAANGYSDGYRTYGFWFTCSCGALFGDECTTDLVCELH